MKDKLLVVKDVNISYGSAPILLGVNCSMSEGDLVYLIGKTGTGKSSLIKTLYADLKLKDGHCEIVGFNLKNIKDKKVPFLRRKIGVVFQDFKLLYDRSVEENLAFVLKATGWKGKKNINKKIYETLKTVGMEANISKMPQQLSGGEQQRIAIARALLNNPKLILADEPTGNLDPNTSFEIMEVLTKLNKEQGISLLISTHNHFLITQYPGRVLKCEHNRVSEMSIPEE